MTEQINLLSSAKSGYPGVGSFSTKLVIMICGVKDGYIPAISETTLTALAPIPLAGMCGVSGMRVPTADDETGW